MPPVWKTATRSPILIASSMSWVTNRIVFAIDLLEAEELVLEPVPDDRVDGPERLVHQHDRRVRRKRPRDTDALPLAARQLAGVAVAVLRRLEARPAPSSSSDRSRWRGFVQPMRRGTVATFSPIVWWGNRPTCWMT